jgi:hypothetical protein
MKSTKPVFVCLFLSIALHFLLSSCAFIYTPRVVSVEYHGHNSFKIGITGNWYSIILGDEVFVKSKITGEYYTITRSKQLSLVISTTEPNYRICFVDRNWTPGDTIIVFDSWEEYKFHVPETLD